MDPNKRKYDATGEMKFGRPQPFPSGRVQDGRVVVRLSGQSLGQVVTVLRSWKYRVTYVGRLQPEELDNGSRRGTWIIRPSVIGSERHSPDVQREKFLRFSESVTHPALLLAAIACHHRFVGTNLIGEGFVAYTEQATGLALLIQFVDKSREFVISKYLKTSDHSCMRISGATHIMR